MFFLEIFLNFLTFFEFNILVKMIETFISFDFQFVLIVGFILFLLMISPLLNFFFKIFKFLVLFPIFVFCCYAIFKNF
jgi:hypothetical protein